MPQKRKKRPGDLERARRRAQSEHDRLTGGRSTSRRDDDFLRGVKSAARYEPRGAMLLGRNARRRDERQKWPEYRYSNGSTIAISGLREDRANPRAPGTTPAPSRSTFMAAIDNIPPQTYERMIDIAARERLYNGYWAPEEPTYTYRDIDRCGDPYCRTCAPRLEGSAEGRRIADVTLNFQERASFATPPPYTTTYWRSRAEISEEVEWRVSNSIRPPRMSFFDDRGPMMPGPPPDIERGRQETFIYWTIEGEFRFDANGEEFARRAEQGDTLEIMIRFEDGGAFRCERIHIRPQFATNAEGDMVLRWRTPRFTATRRPSTPADAEFFNRRMEEEHRHRAYSLDDEFMYGGRMRPYRAARDRMVVRTGHGGRHDYEFRYRVAPEPSPEELRRRAEEEATRLRLAAEQRERETAAKARARELLLSKLTADERECFLKNDYIPVRGSVTGKQYRIMNGSSIGNVKEVEGERTVASYCAAPSGALPLDDKLLGQYLTIRFDEQTFLDKANVTAYDVAGARQYLGAVYARNAPGAPAPRGYVDENLLRAYGRHVVGQGLNVPQVMARMLGQVAEVNNVRLNGEAVHEFTMHMNAPVEWNPQAAVTVDDEGNVGRLAEGAPAYDAGECQFTFRDSGCAENMNQVSAEARQARERDRIELGTRNVEINLTMQIDRHMAEELMRGAIGQQVELLAPSDVTAAANLLVDAFTVTWRNNSQHAERFEVDASCVRREGDPYNWRCVHTVAVEPNVRTPSVRIPRDAFRMNLGNIFSFRVRAVGPDGMASRYSDVVTIVAT